MYIEREIKAKFSKLLKAYNLVALVGARQSGKTTFLKEQMKGFNASYVTFDDPDARSIFDEDIKKFEKQYIESYKITILDEVQNCKDAGKKLKYLADNNRKCWLTSSSEIILGKEVLSYLVGRVSILRLYPFSLTEFMAAKSQKAVNDAIIRRLVWEHLTYGGYPKVVITPDIELKKTILMDLYDTMLLKDIARNFSIEGIKSLEEFARYIAINTGTMLSYEKISSNINISFQTIKKYIDAMEKSYLITRIQPFHTNKSKEIIKQPKLYYVDTGLRNVTARGFSEEIEGKAFENYVLTELIKIGFNPRYWRTKTKAEVDFIVEKEKNIIPVEVKTTLNKNSVERSLHSFIETYKPKKALVVFYKGEEASIKVAGCKVFFTNVLNMRKKLSE